MVAPRLGTVSPWASKATDIAHNCGLAVRRIERVTEFHIGLKAPLIGKAPALSDEQRAAVAALLHDRMTESVLASLDQAQALFAELPATPMAHVDVAGGGRAALVEANKTFGLALAMQGVHMNRKVILVSDPVIDDRLYRRLTDLGAQVERVPAEAESVAGGFQAARLARLAEIQAELPATFCPEQYSNPDNPRSYAAVAELLLECLGQVDCLVGPVGSGGVEWVGSN